VIDTKIYDYYDDFNYGKVNYTPIAASEINIESPNTAPTLSWPGAGYTGYETDGLDYEVGTTTTVYTYKVKYADTDGDAPASGYPKLYIYSGAVLVQTLIPEYSAGSYVTGAIYSTSTKLSAASDYTYYFEAYDDHDGSSKLATGSPTSSVDAPDVTVGNNSPTLTWEGTSGYEADGVSPDSGDTSTSFVFKVKYTDADNDAPLTDYPRVELGLDGYWYMSEEDSLDNNDGYFFTAYDANNNIASGEATSQKGGPAVSSPGSYAIYGYVLNNSSNPLSSITVGLYDNSVSPPSRFQYRSTDEYGFYEFNSIESGKNCFVVTESDVEYTWSYGQNGSNYLDSDLRVDFFGTLVGAGYTVSGYCYDESMNEMPGVYVWVILMKAVISV